MTTTDRVRAAERGERRFAWWLSAPGLLVLVATTTLPIFYLLWQSTQSINLALPGMGGFVGLENYARLWNDTRFWDSLELTLVYTASTVILQLILGLGMAILILRLPRAQGIFRVMAILPIVLAPVVVGMIWRTLMLTQDYGILDFVFGKLGLGTHNWLGEPKLAVISVVAIHTWQWTPFVFLYLLAALSTIPEELYDAARIDRAGAWRRFTHITVPMIRPAIVMVVIIRMTVALSAFAAIYAATGGGPGTATEILNLFAYRVSFAELDLGYGAASAVVLLLLTLAVSAGLFSLRRAQ